MAFTDNGLESKRLPSIKESLRESLKEEFGSGIDTSESSVLGVINSIFAAGLTDLHSLNQSVYSSFILQEAQGKSLDDLVALVNIERLDAQPARGIVVFTANAEGIVIESGTQLETRLQQEVVTTESVETSLSSTPEATIGLNGVTSFVTYEITIEGETFTKFISFSATSASQIVDRIVSEINSEKTVTTYTAVDNLDGTFSLAANNPTDNLSIAIDAKMQVNEIKRDSPTATANTGAITIVSGDVDTLSTPVSGVSSVTNPFDFIDGSEEETDEELRGRHAASVVTSRSATPTAIKNAVEELTGVTRAFVFENRGVVTDGDGRPAKSYEVVVEGGDDGDIGQTIWDVGPAGVETYGDQQVAVEDAEDFTHQIYFSRPEVRYIHCQVEYTKYSEEDFPSDGETKIANALAAAGDDLDIGVDVIPKRLYNAIYSGVEGIQDLVIKIAVGSSPGGSPDTSYSESTVAMDEKQVADFDTNRITVTLV